MAGPRRGGELLARRGEGAGSRLASSSGAVCRTLAAAAFGATIFQAAQSLQVPAYEPRLVGFWAAGSLLYAAAVSSRGAHAVALVAGLVWFGWFLADSGTSAWGAVVSILLAGLGAAAVATLPREIPSRTGVTAQWRLLGTALTLAGLFAAALPFGFDGGADLPQTPVLVIWAVCLTLAVVALVVVARRRHGRPNAAGLLVAAAATALGAWLCRWQPVEGMTSPADMTAEAWARAVLAVVVFLLVAAWYAVLGTLSESPDVTALALAGLVLFVTVQSFAVFAPIVSGALLFIVVGAVMVATGLFAGQMHRRLPRLTARRRRRAGRPAPRTTTAVPVDHVDPADPEEES